jgi:high-affinity nickel permease
MQGGAGLGLILLVSLLLGLRHASDPDHLAAVTTLVASDRGPVKTAASLGLAWGLGHGTTLLVVGLPFVLLGRYLPEAAVQAAEVAVGVLIVFLAARLLLRWRHGMFHAHVHAHPGSHSGGKTHRHLHGHASGPEHQQHSHVTPFRTPFSAYAVGLLHGVGGSAGLTLLLISTISDPVLATGALLIFALGTALSMALLSTLFGVALVHGPISRHFERAVPVFGVLAACFGIWYGLGALEVVAYPL